MSSEHCSSKAYRHMVKQESGEAAAPAPAARVKRAAAKRKAVVEVSEEGGRDGVSSGEEDDYKPPKEESASESGGAGEASESEEAPKKRKKAKAKADDEEYVQPEPDAKPPSHGTTKREVEAKAKKEALGRGELTFAAAVAKVDPAAWEATLARFLALGNAKLQALLKLNEQLSSGTKAELAGRCAEGVLLGPLPGCPVCKVAVLKYDQDATTISGGTLLYASCPGRFSESGEFMSCSFTGALTGPRAMPRLPWREPGQAAAAEEPAAAEEGPGSIAAALAATARAPALGLSLSEPVAAAIAALDSVKDATEAMLRECRAAKLSLKGDDKELRVKVSTLLLAMRSGAGFDAHAVFTRLVEQHPPRSEALGGAVCPENSLLAAAFAGAIETELDQWKKKTLITAAKAIKVWPDVITCGKDLCDGPRKVKGLGKGSSIMIDNFLAHGTLYYEHTGDTPEKPKKGSSKAKKAE